MRIVYLNPSAELGGAERVLLDLIASTRQSSPDIDLVVVLGANGPLASEAVRLGAGVRVLPLPSMLAKIGDSALGYEGRLGAAMTFARDAIPAGLAALRYRKMLAGILRELNPDVIHSNGNKMHLLAALCRPAAAAIVWHVHDFLSSRRLMSRILRGAARRASGAIAISGAIAQDVRSTLAALPVQVVYDAIDVDDFSPAPAEATMLDRLAGREPAPEGTVRVGLVATYARWKGHGLFLDAIARVQASPPRSPIRFYIVGGPIYDTRGSQFSEAELRSMAARLGVAGSVGFIGFQRSPAPIYRALDVVVHASTSPEPFGRTIVEAMGCGRPVIVARGGGAAELFTHDEDAVGFPPGEADELAAAMVSLADDPARRLRLGERARQTAVQRFSRARFGREILEAYRSFTGTSPQPGSSPAPHRRAARERSRG
ncbi:MAG: glycosyltransferase [Candidatus Rokubacteria bacterium]|nr:glycosyltransferase [Candidatus Rokubacteria bacterium]